jgi:hypothetical protein
MSKWIVAVNISEDIEVEANTQEQAEAKALEMFDPTAHDAEVSDSWEVTEQGE